MSLSVNHLSFSYSHGLPVLSDICLELQIGEICTILGPNGAGKSTLLNCLGGYLTPTRGQVLLNGEDIATMRPGYRAQKIGLVAQSNEVTVDLDVQDYLTLGRAARLGLCALPGKHEYREIERVMNDMGVNHLRRKSLSCLSGGERQQIEIVRVLVQDTDVILMDEPTNHLDYGNQIKILNTIRHLCHRRKKTVVLTTHIPDHALLLGQTVAIVDAQGRLTTGPVADMLDEKRLQQMYHANIRIVQIDELHRRACVPSALEEDEQINPEEEEGAEGSHL